MSSRAAALAYDDTFHALPIDDDRDGIRKSKTSNAATGASAAGVRAVSAQFLAFYFRAPVKAFFRTRVDYLAYAKAISPETPGWSWRNTTPGLLHNAIRTYGWRFIPDQVLPPLFANVTVGAILYTSYLQILGSLHEPSSNSARRVFPPPPPMSTFAAGTMAGAIQSLVAAPLDALQVRFDRSDAIDGKWKYKNMVSYGRHKLAEIGARGIFAGWSLSLLKDSIGCGIFFSTFEYVKAQCYYQFVAWYYSRQASPLLSPRGSSDFGQVKPHYAIEPLFLLFAGTSASVTQQTVQYPLSHLQSLHYERLESLDHVFTSSHRLTRSAIFQTYYNAYSQTLTEARIKAQNTIKTSKNLLTGQTTRKHLSLAQWLYRGFWWNTIRQVPSTSAGLVIFELVRRKYGTDLGEEVRIRGRGGSGRDIVIY